MRLLGLVLIAILASLLGGCAQQLLNASQNACSAYGFQPGTNEFAGCVQSEYARRHAAFQQGLSNMSNQLQQPAMTTSAPVGGGAARGAGFLRSQVVQGMNRICVYDRLGSPVAVTIGSAEMCPLTLR